MGVAAFDHPVLDELLGDPEIAALLDFRAELEAMLAFEGALARAQAELGVIETAAAEAVARACADFELDLAALRAATARDGVVVPELVRQLRRAVGEPHARSVHHGATSQDVIDTAFLLRARRVAELLERRLERLEERLAALEHEWADRRLWGRTRMRRAEPITWADKIASWRAPLLRHRQRLAELGPRLFRVQLGGAVGDRRAFGPRAQAIADRMADALGLARAPRATHAERDAVAEFASWLSLVAGSLGKLGQDVCLLVQDEVAELVVEGGGGSSAMPHKVNPVAAEVLVALARFAAGSAGIVLQATVHENERSGAAWTLEWLALPPLLMATGAATRTALRLVEQLRLPERPR